MIRPLWQLQDREKAPLQEADLSVLFGPKSKIEKKNQMPTCLVLPAPLPVPPSALLLRAYTHYVSLMPEIFNTMAEKMQSALLVTAHPAKKARKRKPKADKPNAIRLCVLFLDMRMANKSANFHWIRSAALR